MGRPHAGLDAPIHRRASWGPSPAIRGAAVLHTARNTAPATIDAYHAPRVRLRRTPPTSRRRRFSASAACHAQLPRRGDVHRWRRYGTSASRTRRHLGRTPVRTTSSAGRHSQRGHSPASLSRRRRAARSALPDRHSASRARELDRLAGRRPRRSASPRSRTVRGRFRSVGKMDGEAPLTTASTRCAST